MRNIRIIAVLLTLLAVHLVSLAEAAEINVGITLGMTGPTASAGISYKSVLGNLPPTIAGQPAKYAILDDGGDATVAVKNARKLISENNIDVLIGSSTVPGCLAVIDVATENKVPQICMAPLTIPDAKRAWVFMAPAGPKLMISAVVDRMKETGVKTVGYIGFSDGLGDILLRALTDLAGEAGIKVVANERFNRPDTDVSAQVLRVIAANPDAVYVGAALSPAALPHITLVDNGYKGKIYHTDGIVGADFLRVGGPRVEGAIAPSGPFVVAERLPNDFPSKAVAMKYAKEYDAANPGRRNGFAGMAYDTYIRIDTAAKTALGKGRPGTVEFRQALRDALESAKEVVGTSGIYNTSPADHNGLDHRARVLVEVRSGKFELLKK